MQSYIANQPYFNRFTGKGEMTPSTSRPMSRFSSLTLSEANTFHRYNTFPAASTWGFNFNGNNRLDHITKKHKEKPVSSRQLENTKMSPVPKSGTIPLSTVENIPIIRPFISRSNSYLFHNLFPPANSNFLPRNDNDGTGSSFYSNPFTPHPVKALSLRNRFTSVSQTNALASNNGLYENQNRITSSSPLLVNGYLKGSTFPNDGITHSLHNTETRQELSTNPYSYFRLPVKTTQRHNFQLTQYSFFKPVSSNVTNDSAFRSALNSAFYPRRPLLGKSGKVSSAEDKVVTEGELNEKGLLSDILSRDHIHRKPG